MKATVTTMKAATIIFLALIGSFVVSCESHTYEEISGEIANPTYTANVKSIIQNNCLSCHSTAGAEFPTMETYDQVKDATQNGNVICRINGACGDVMPQTGKMPQSNINVIQNWANNGYPN